MELSHPESPGPDEIGFRCKFGNKLAPDQTCFSPTGGFDGHGLGCVSELL